jgi:hypothetical protein
MNFSSDVEDDDDENRAFYHDEYFEAVKATQVCHLTDCPSQTLSCSRGFSTILIVFNASATVLEDDVLVLNTYRHVD